MKIFAFRGYSTLYQENTMLAYQKAMEAGADGISLDVQFSKDQELVVFADDSLADQTDGKGTIHQHDCEEIKTYHFTSSKPGSKEKIPCLEEYFNWAKLLTTQTIIYLKNNDFENADQEERLFRLADLYGLSNKVILASHSRENLRLIHEKNPEWALAMVISEEEDMDPKVWANLGVSFVIPDIKLLTKDFIEDLNKNRMTMVPFGAETEEDFRKLKDLNPPACITKEVETARMFFQPMNISFKRNQALQARHFLEEGKKEKKKQLISSTSFISLLIAIIISVGGASLITMVIRNVLENFITK